MRAMRVWLFVSIPLVILGGLWGVRLVANDIIPFAQTDMAVGYPLLVVGAVLLSFAIYFGRKTYSKSKGRKEIEGPFEKAFLSSLFGLALAITGLINVFPTVGWGIMAALIGIFPVGFLAAVVK